MTNEEAAGTQPAASERPNGDGDGDARTAELEADLARMEDRYKRALADLDNYRKRSGTEAQRRVDESRESLLRDWLDAVDSVERALLMQPEGPVLEGLQSVLEQMEAILGRQGVRRMDAVGHPFDPERHEAIAVQEAEDVPDRTVIQTARSGYATGDHVLRPAQVVVSRPREQQS
ncbi:MAG: molecular chaperone GrpE [Gaiellales bacterium]|jgi:molecular chaperone GrpE|nr:molecular chaperone GrpE [Gaiellales bacterium]